MNRQYSKSLKYAESLGEVLFSQKSKIVFAESCTAGMAAAMLGTVPGISAVLCGSAVTYREQTKRAWLGVSAEILARHTAESAEVASAMAKGVLHKTPEADLAAAIVGHLGPEASDSVDGIVHFCVVARSPNKAERSDSLVLTSTDRQSRQFEAAGVLLREACEFMNR